MEREDRKAELIATLGEMAERLRTSDGWMHWLSIARRLHNYSLNNQLLILAQRPTASAVMGYKAWQALGRQVNKGERAIWILAPVVTRIADEEKLDEPGQRKVVAFRPTTVFDVEQTSGPDLPSHELPPVRVPDDGLRDGLVQVARDAGYTVELVTGRGDSARGWFNWKTNTISIVDDYPLSSQVRTALHELAHAVDPVVREEGALRAERELVAESAAFLSAGTLGVDTTDASAVYAAHWGGDKDRLLALAGQALAAARAVDEITAPLRQLAAA